jgi:ribonuclease-3
VTGESEGPNELEDLAALEAKLGHVFGDRTLLTTALQHSSYAHEEGGLESNERLEFLGDSVIGLVVADLLMRAHPDWAEGRLTRALSSLVDRRSLAELAQQLEIGPYLRLGRTEVSSDGAAKPSILADAIEALMGAMYLDAGLAPVRSLAERVFEKVLSADADPVERDPKTRFQESVVVETGVFPTYRTVHDSEVDGDEERFRVCVMVEGESFGEGVGRSKRVAEREAARAALYRTERDAPDVAAGQTFETGEET